MNLEELEKRIKESKTIKHKGDRLCELRNIAEDIGNNFTESMSILENEIEYVLDRTSQKIKDECGYHDVSDVTADINVHSTSDYNIR